MLVLPIDSPETTPDATEAIEGSALDHAPPDVASDKVIVPYMHMGLVPDESARAAAAALFTDTVAVEEHAPTVYFKVVTPVVPVDVQAPVVGLTVPTVVGVLLQVPEPRLFPNDSPVVDEQMANGPPGVPPDESVMGPGAMVYVNATGVE